VNNGSASLFGKNFLFLLSPSISRICLPVVDWASTFVPVICT